MLCLFRLTYTTPMVHNNIMLIEEHQLTANGRFIQEVNSATKPNSFNPDERLWNDNVLFQLNVMGGYLWLFSFRSVERSKGNASRCLDFLCSLADKHQITISLSPGPFGKDGLNKRQLLAWYQRHGFEKRNDFPVYMREPKAEA
jgi:hypothetical protein